MAEEALKRITSLDPFSSITAPAQKKVEESAKAKAEFETARDTMQAQREADLAAGTAAQGEALAKGMREIPQREERAKISKEAAVPFVPTKETAGDLAQMFALINIAGFAIGAGGKRNAQAAMSAMNGMMEGYQKGRMDLYKKEKEQFDTNLKRMKTQIDVLDREIKDAVELMKTDYQSGIEKLRVAYAQTGATFYKDMEEKRGVANLLEHHKAVKKEIDGAIERAQRHEERARAQAFREQQARESSLFKRQQLDMQRTMLQMRMEQAEKKGETAGKLKAGDKDRQAYIADNILLADVSDIAKDIRTDPKLVQMLKQYRVEAFLTEESKILNQVLNEDIPPELRRFLTKVRDVRNNYYLNISGKAVTGGEALRNYGTVPQPGDSPEGMLDKLDGMAGRIGRTIGVRQQMYGLPKLNIEPGTPTGLTPGENYGPSTGQGAAPAAPAAAASDRGSDEKGSYRWEYNADRTQRRKVYD